MEEKKPRRLIPLTKWNQFHLWPTIGGLRHLVAFAKQKNFEQVLVRANGRVLIDEEAFFEWVDDSENGKHIVPHDAAAHEYSTGLSRVEVARNHGIAFTIAPDIGLIEGIDAARNILNRCWLDEAKCALGIKALENYKKEWNDRHGCWSSYPLHNFASHGADAFRMIAVNLSRLENKGLTVQEWRNLRNEYFFLKRQQMNMKPTALHFKKTSLI